LQPVASVTVAKAMVLAINDRVMFLSRMPRRRCDKV
jgi:hypothetical protein